MPKVTKDIKEIELKNNNNSAKTTKKSTSSSTSNKKSSTKTSTIKETAKSKTTSKQVKSNNNKNLAKSTTSKKKSATTKKRKTASKLKEVESTVVAEYYDLPYRYNETIVKILYQTPNVLFVYWDISDDDRSKFINNYGENFFLDTKPFLKIYNLTKNYNFEVEINDFANSWYINVNDANCDYKVELTRKPIQFSTNINSDYIYITSSNNIEFPNDHILIEELPSKINFKNVKTNKITTKDIRTLRLVGINKIYNVNDFYKKLYKDEILEEINNKKFIKPSSSSWN